MPKFAINAPITDNNWLVFLFGILTGYLLLLPTSVTLKAQREYTLYRTADLESTVLFLPPLNAIGLVALFSLVRTIMPAGLQTYWTIGFICGLVYPALSMIKDYGKQVYGLKTYATAFILGQIAMLPFFGLLVNFIAGQIGK